jgi:hypothetical protein
LRLHYVYMQITQALASVLHPLERISSAVVK